MGLGLITLFFLGCFSLLYLSRAPDGPKPEWLVKAAAWVESHLEPLAFWGMIYSVVSLALLLVAVRGPALGLVALAANALLFALTLPFTLENALAKTTGRIPAGVEKALRDLAAAVDSRKQAAGYAGAAACFLLFLVLFR